eukprot:403343492
MQPQIRESADLDYVNLNRLSLGSSRKILQQDEQEDMQSSINDFNNPLIQRYGRAAEEKVQLVQESFPNYAQIDHFAVQDTSKRLNNQDAQNVQSQDQDINQQQKQSQFHEEIKKLRDQMQEEYDAKLKINIKELENYKNQLTNTMKDTDQQKLSQFHKQLQDKDKQIYHLNAKYIENEQQIKDQERLVQEKEEIVLNYKQLVDQLKNDHEIMRQQVLKYQQKEDVIRDYTEGLKRQNDQLKQANQDLSEKLGELSKQDWSKQIIEYKRECDFLREEIAQKVNELGDLKNNLSLSIQQTNAGNAANHFTNLLESQSKEIVRMKRVIEEFEKREKQCSRKWSALLQENLSLQEKQNGLNMQLQRQKDQYQSLVAQLERKIIEANQRFAFIQQIDDKRAAAEYLVEQMRVISEEKQSVIYENQGLHKNIQDIQDELQKLLRECSEFIAIKSGQQYSGDAVAQSQGKLLMRIEELEDLIQDLKNQQSSQEMVELKQLIASKELEIQRSSTKIGDMRRQRVTFQNLFENNELHENFQKQMNEKNNQIQLLKRELNQLKNSDFMGRMTQQNTTPIQSIPHLQVADKDVKNNYQIYQNPKIGGDYNILSAQNNPPIKYLNQESHGNSWLEEKDKWILQDIEKRQ